MTTDNPTTTRSPAAPVVNPGPSKEVWDEALKNSGLEPQQVVEYNVPDGQAPGSKQ